MLREQRWRSETQSEREREREGGEGGHRKESRVRLEAGRVKWKIEKGNIDNAWRVRNLEIRKGEYLIHAKSTARTEGMHSRYRLAVFRGAPGGKGWIHLRCIYYWRLCASRKETARTHVWMLARICRDRYLGFFCFRSGDCGRGVPACMQTSIRAPGVCPVVCLPMTSGLGCQLPGSR